VQHKDKSYRSLKGLEKTASTSRVMNLSVIANKNDGDPDYLASPMFRSPLLNTAVLIKHRLRADENYLFDGHHRIGTKVVIPFERTDLSLGGRSFFVGQRGWLELFQDIRGPVDGEARDLEVLEALDELPSLDPFLVREHLKRRSLKVAPCYFAISPSDVRRMEQYVAGQISQLVDLAYSGAQMGEKNLAKLVGVLLSGEDDARLDPLRMTLGMQGAAYGEGIFCWRGFLYYKWVLNTIWTELNQVLDELTKVQITGPRDYELLTQVNAMTIRVRASIVAQVRTARSTLGVYDQAFVQLTEAGNPAAFRTFLLQSPALFVSLGERAGMISHIASFWRYRFPKGKPLRANLDDLYDMLQEFYTGLGDAEEAEADLARQTEMMKMRAGTADILLDRPTGLVATSDQT
jgi:hypothetical protein